MREVIVIEIEIEIHFYRELELESSGKMVTKKNVYVLQLLWINGWVRKSKVHNICKGLKNIEMS